MRDAGRTWHLIHPGRRSALLYLHGSLQSGKISPRFTDHSIERLGESLGATVILPDGYDHHFNDARAQLRVSARRDRIDDVAFLAGLVEGYDRVVACGFSNGGQMVLRLLIDAPGLIDQAGIFAANVPTDENLVHQPTGWVPTPVCLVAGTEDRLSPYAGGEAAFRNRAVRGPVRSARESVEWLARRNGCGAERTVEELPETTVLTAPGPAPVQLWTLHGVGHAVMTRRNGSDYLGALPTVVTGVEAFTEFLGL